MELIVGTRVPQGMRALLFFQLSAMRGREATEMINQKKERCLIELRSDSAQASTGAGSDDDSTISLIESPRVGCAILLKVLEV